MAVNGQGIVAWEVRAEVRPEPIVVEDPGPGLWFLAEADGKLVGAVLCPNYEDEGWIRQLAVARDWRRRGLGTALLRQALGEFHRRGRNRVGLVVELQVAPVMLMHVAREHTRYEKQIQAAG